MEREEKEIKVKVIEEIRLKKAEIRKFKRGRGGKSGRTPGRVRKAAVFAAALAGLSLCFPGRYRRHGRAAVPAC